MDSECLIVYLMAEEKRFSTALLCTMTGVRLGEDGAVKRGVDAAADE